MSSVAKARPNSVASTKPAFGERHLETVRDRLHGVAHRHRRVRRPALRQRPRLGPEGGGGHDTVDEADPARLGRVDEASAEEQFQGAALPDQPRQPLRAGEAGNEPELDLGLAEPRRVGRQPDRAGHRQFAAAAEGEAVDRGDDRLAEPLDQVEDPLSSSAWALPASGVSVASS